MMKKLKDAKKYIIGHKYFLMGFLVVFLYLFNNMIFGQYTLSYTNISYRTSPFDSYNIDIIGPVLSDVADSFYPSVFRIFYSGNGVNLWNNMISLGAISTDIQNILSPFNIVYLFPLKVAVFFKVFSEFLIGFISMYMYMRAINARKFPSAIAGVIYTFSAVMVVWLGWPHSDVAAIAPLLFYAVEKLIDEMKIKYMVLCAFVIYCMLIAGMPTYAAYFLYLVGIYLVVNVLQEHWHNKRNIVVICIMFAIGVGLGATMSLPYTYSLLTSVGRNGYAESRLHFSQARLGIEYLRTFVYPYVRDGMSLHMNESTLYVGIFTVTIFPFLLVNGRKKKRNYFFLISSFVVLGLIFSDLFNFLFIRLPMINTSLKYRVIVILMFTVSVLAGLALNDVIENKDYYLKRNWLIVVQVVWGGIVICLSSKGLYTKLYSEIHYLIIIMICSSICFWALVKENNRYIRYLIAVIIICDSVGFANQYLPWIPNGVSVVPDPTDSVQYLMDHTSQDRVLGIGMWMLFPNTQTYYELCDIRMHDFVATNADIQAYYKKIDNACYDTNTRVSFKGIEDIDSFELLKYMGVKYVYGNNLYQKTEIGSITDKKEGLGIISNDATISQELILDTDIDISAVQLLFATYGTIPECNHDITLKLYKKETGEQVAESNIKISEIVDNQFSTFYFEKTKRMEADTAYVLELYFPDMENETITFWKSLDQKGIIDINGSKVEGSIIMNMLSTSDDYTIAYEGKDGVEIGEVTEHAARVELIENIKVFSEDDEILNEMEKEYIPNTAFLAKNTNVQEYSLSLSNNETADILEYNDDYIKILCNTEHDRLLLINDYYAEGWNAYVNGKKEKIVKSNYLMRAVNVPEGEKIVVELKYEPNEVKITMACFGASLTVLIILWIFRKRLQVIIDNRILCKI